MSESSFEQSLARGLRDPDLAGALSRLREAWSEGSFTESVDEDGFRVASLLIARLRFERLVQGDREAASRFEKAPSLFVSEFKRYHAEVPMTAESPAGEARLFRDWTNAGGSA